MNEVLREIASTSSLGWVAGVMTAVFLFFFMAWTLWAWWPGNRARLDAAARLVLDDDSVGGEA